MRLKSLILSLLLAACARAEVTPVAMISNLNTPGPGGGIGDLETLVPGSGFGLGFVTGASALTLSSVTFEFYGYSPAGFRVQLYTFGPPGSVPPPAWPLVPYATLDQAQTDARPTLWPGQTAFVDFSSSTTITLTPHSAYVIAATEDATGNNDNALRFGYSEAYAVAPDWQLYPAGNMNQWSLDPTLGGWLDSAQSGYLGLVLELNAAPVPEPSPLLLWLAGLLGCWGLWPRAKGSHTPRAGQPA